MSAAVVEGVGPPRWPVTLLTGMLGSGKTTLLRRLLADSSLSGTAVLINEIGEIGLDHHLVERIDGETILLPGGCLCCTLRADLPRTLSALRRRWLGDGTLDLRRVVVETTGLADPGPILAQLATHPLISADFPLAGVVATVDAQFGAAQLASRQEAWRQIAVADHIVLTKTDLVTTPVHRDIEGLVRALNAAVPIVPGASAAADVFLASGFTPGEAIWWWAGNPGPSVAGIPGRAFSLVHGASGIGTLALRTETALDWGAFQHGLEAVCSEFAPDLLRLKGILNVKGSARPIVVHAVHDACYPAANLAAWPDTDHGSRLVLIVNGLAASRARLLALACSGGVDWRPV